MFLLASAYYRQAHQGTRPKRLLAKPALLDYQHAALSLPLLQLNDKKIYGIQNAKSQQTAAQREDLSAVMQTCETLTGRIDASQKVKSPRQLAQPHAYTRARTAQDSRVQ